MARSASDRLVAVLTTVGSEDVALRIARELVERRLAACVNVIPSVRSVYRWEGAVQDDLELLLIVKTTSVRLPTVEDAIRALHPYEVPEIVALPTHHVAASYARWVVESVREESVRGRRPVRAARRATAAARPRQAKATPRTAAGSRVRGRS
jgi:periplasmic divalent cation tolerance protein